MHICRIDKNREKNRKRKENFREQIHCMFLNSVRYGEDRKEMKTDKVLDMNGIGCTLV